MCKFISVESSGRLLMNRLKICKPPMIVTTSQLKFSKLPPLTKDGTLSKEDDRNWFIFTRSSVIVQRFFFQMIEKLLEDQVVKSVHTGIWYSNMISLKYFLWATISFVTSIYLSKVYQVTTLLGIFLQNFVVCFITIKAVPTLHENLANCLFEE